MGVTELIASAFRTPNVPTVTTPANNSTTRNNRPPVTGTAEPNSTVVIYIDGVPVGTTTADAMGNYTFTPTAMLSDGAHTVAAQDIVGGAASATSATNRFNVDTTAPAVAITAPANGSTTMNSRPPITGTAEPGSTLTLVIDGGTPVTVTVDPMGRWTFTPTTDLANGMHTVAATATDAAGNSAMAMSAFTVNTPGPMLAITAPANGSTTSNNRPTITGTSDPGATVTVSIDGGTSVTVMADAMGRWSVPAGAALSDGSHTVNARTMNSAGTVANASTTFTVDTTAP
jgi:hypothetical protein